MTAATHPQPAATPAVSDVRPDGYDVRQVYRDRVEVLAPGDALPTVYRYESALPKPCVHPLRTPGGACLSGFEMSDHVWHRGLWFAIKYLNGVNFWEENGEGFGVQRSAAEPRVRFLQPDRVRLEHDLQWTSPATGVAMTEHRTLTFQWVDEHTRRIDWRSELRPELDLELDRTPFTTWGGYGGLSLRSAREVHGAELRGVGGEPTDLLAGDPYPGVLLRGRVDGGSDRRVSVGLIDAATNPRTPSPWYAKVGEVNYLNAAFLFHEPMRVVAGQPLVFAYRLVYGDGSIEPSWFTEMTEDYRLETEARS